MPYRVVYSEAVKIQLRELLQSARTRGLGPQALQAVRDLDYRLHIYPQFGEPLRVLHTAGETLWIGVVPPLVIRYIIDEVQQVVFVAARFKLLPRSGLE